MTIPKGSALGFRFTPPSSGPKLGIVLLLAALLFTAKVVHQWLSVTASEAIWHARHASVPALR